MTYYLKYRPQTIDEIDINTVRESLSNIVKSGSIPHALLFSGPRGTGKTSLARIVAKAINCEHPLTNGAPCNKCNSCKSIISSTNIDVIEMDAASNRGIDDIRSLRDVVKLAPAGSKAKVYIIDEAHMLTTEASNALLKTLEEPPSHVYFILATTNPEKLIDTIKSRTTQISFDKATGEEMKRSLERIIKKEKLKVNDKDVEELIKIANGSFRDAVKNLEQYVSDKTFLNSNQQINLDEFITSLEEKDIKKTLADLKKISNFESFTNDLLEGLHNKLIKSEAHNLIPLIELILEAQEFKKFSPIEELPLEMAFIKWCKL